MTNTAITVAKPAATAESSERGHVGALGRDGRARERGRREDRGADLGADDAPTVRMTVLMPVAMPVSVGSTASVMSAAIAANAKPTPTLEPRHRDDDLPRLVVERGEPDAPRRDDQHHAERERPLRPDAAAEQPREPGRRRA